MLNQIPLSTEASHSGVFLKNYLEYIEEFPDDIMRIISVCRELDTKTYSITEEVNQISEQYVSSTGDKKSKLYARLTQILIKLQDLNDEKIHLGQIVSEMIETRYREVDTEFQNLISFSLNRRDENINENAFVKQERAQSPVPSTSSTARNASIVQQVLSNLPLKTSSNTGSNMSTSTNNSASEVNVNSGNGNGAERSGSKRSRRTRTDTNPGTEVDRVEVLEVPIKVEASTSKQAVAAVVTSTATTKKGTAANVVGKKKKRKTGRQSGNQSNQSTQALREQAAGIMQEETIDPDEPTYCLCDQISYGEMIMCENDLCSIEWFHFSCVSLQSKPKGRWYCPQCRGDRPNVMNKNLRKKYQDSPNMDRKFI